MRHYVPAGQNESNGAAAEHCLHRQISAHKLTGSTSSASGRPPVEIARCQCRKAMAPRLQYAWHGPAIHCDRAPLGGSGGHTPTTTTNTPFWPAVARSHV